MSCNTRAWQCCEAYINSLAADWYGQHPCRYAGARPGCSHTSITAILSADYVHCPAGEAEEQGYEDEYQLEDLVVCPMSSLSAPLLPAQCTKWPAEAPAWCLLRPYAQTGCAAPSSHGSPYYLQVGPADYVAPTPVPNFRAAWEALPEEAEMADDYGLGQVCCRCPVVSMALCLPRCLLLLPAASKSAITATSNVAPACNRH
jgi:hypothetical protein